MTLEEKIAGCFLGLAVGDALGVPVEFQSRDQLRKHPVTDMRGHGTWNQPAGTWSDDSSLAFCTAQSLLNGYNIVDIGSYFVRWIQHAEWTAHNEVFDVGGTTRSSIGRIVGGEHPYYAGDLSEYANGNGSLMRIAPASIYFHSRSDSDLYERMREVSGITHRHFRSIFSCFIFSKVIQKIIAEPDDSKLEVYRKAMVDIRTFIQTSNIDSDEFKFFQRITDESLTNADQARIGSTGYVLHTLEASLWCFLTTDSYKTAVLKAANLGEDTDTTACVTGALAGLYYGIDEIPKEWISRTSRSEDIRNLATLFYQSISSQ